MREIVKHLFSGHEHYELYMGVIETIEGITKNVGPEIWLEASRGIYDSFNKVGTAVYDAGMMGLGLPEEYGGLGGGILGPVIMTDLMAQKGVCSFNNMITHFSRYPVVTHGTPEQIEKYVLPTLTDRKTYCILATEPNAGTNTFNNTTKAVRKGDGWVLNGQKIWISCADQADFGFLIAKTGLDNPRALSIFVIDMKLPGIEMTKLNADVFPGEDQFSVFFQDVELPLDALIGNEGEGAKCMFEGLNTERILVASMALGLSDLALQIVLEHVKHRAPFGQPIGSYQSIQHRLAEAKAHSDAARLMTYYAAKVYDEGGDAGIQANMAKLLASTSAVKMVDEAIQFHGGSGMDEDTGLLSIWRIVRTTRFAPVNNEVIMNFIAQRELGLPKSY